jgi:hypothetical protein
MERVDISSRAGNVYTLNLPNERSSPLIASVKKAHSRRVMKISSIDANEARGAGEVVETSFGNFLLDADERDMFGFVLDGKTYGERSDADEHLMGQLVGFLSQPRSDSSDDIQRAQFESAVFESETPEDSMTLRALSVASVDGKITIYLSADLGFRESLLAAHYAYSDYAAIVARSLGISIKEGDVAKQLSITVSTGMLPMDEIEGDAPQPIGVVIDGETVVGIPR